MACGVSASLDSDSSNNKLYSAFTNGIKKLIMNNLLPKSIKAQNKEKDQDKGAVTSCGLSKIPGLNEMDALSQQDETAVERCRMLD